MTQRLRTLSLPCGTLCLFFLLLTGLVAPVGAEDVPGYLAQVKALALTENEVQNLEDIALGTYQAVVAARAEVSSARAVLTRQLLLPSVTVKDLEPTVRKSIEAEYRVRLAELDRQLKIRRLIGDRRWARLMDLAATMKKQTSPSDDAGDDSQTNRVLNVLRVLGS